MRMGQWWIAAAIVGAIAVPARAQDPPRVAGVETTAAIAAPAADQSGDEGGVAKRLARDVLSDYKNMFSVENGQWLGIGGIAAFAVHSADESIMNSATASNTSLPGGDEYGSQLLHIPIAVAWWGIASAAGSSRHAETGRDLVRAQISTFSWTYLIKIAVQRTRPNGDPHSFPSGHASTTWATAMVLQEHYGWKVGLPAFAAAAYTGVSRIYDNQHWASDIVFGAALGMVCARTVTIHFRESQIKVAPMTVPSGAGIGFTVLRQP